MTAAPIVFNNQNKSSMNQHPLSVTGWGLVATVTKSFYSPSKILATADEVSRKEVV